MNFLKFLNENNTKYPWQFDTKEKIERWLQFHPATKILPSKLNNDLTISYLFTLNIGDDDLIQWSDGNQYIPVQFTEVDDYSFTSFKPGASLIGGPKKVTKCVIKTGTVKSFEGIPEEAESMNLANWNNLTSLKDIHKHLKSCEQMIVPLGIKSNILGLLNINDLQIATPPHGDAPELINALIILHKHHRGDRDVLACQEELISGGLKEFAKL